MSMKRNSMIVAALLAANVTGIAVAGSTVKLAHTEGAEHDHQALKQAPRPHARTTLPPSAEQVKFNPTRSFMDKTNSFELLIMIIMNHLTFI